MVYDSLWSFVHCRTDQCLHITAPLHNLLEAGSLYIRGFKQPRGYMFLVGVIDLVAYAEVYKVLRSAARNDPTHGTYDDL